MLKKSLQENELLIDWMGQLEFKSSQLEEKMGTVDGQINKTI